MLKIKVKDVKEFIDEERVLYASGESCKLYITLKSGPNVERYIVLASDESHGFTKLDDAVRLFNDIESQQA